MGNNKPAKQTDLVTLYKKLTQHLKEIHIALE